MKVVLAIYLLGLAFHIGLLVGLIYCERTIPRRVRLRHWGYAIMWPIRSVVTIFQMVRT